MSAVQIELLWRLGGWKLDRVRCHAFGKRWWRKAVQATPKTKLYEMVLKLLYAILREKSR